MQSYCHLLIIHGSGAGSLKPLIHKPLRLLTEPLDAELLKHLGKPGQTAFVRWKRCRVSGLSLQLPNPHEPRQHSLSTVDGQVRNRAESDLPGLSANAGRCTPEMLHTDVLFVGLDDEKQSPKSGPIC